MLEKTSNPKSHNNSNSSSSNNNGDNNNTGEAKKAIQRTSSEEKSKRGDVMRLLNWRKVLTLSTVSMLSLSGCALACASALVFIQLMNTGMYTRLLVRRADTNTNTAASSMSQSEKSKPPSGMGQPGAKLSECGAQVQVQAVEGRIQPRCNPYTPSHIPGHALVR